MWTRKELKTNAKQALTNKWFKAVGITILVSILNGSAFTTSNIIKTTQDTSSAVNIGFGYININLDLLPQILTSVFLFGILFMFLLSLALQTFFGNLISIGHSKFYLNNRKNSEGFMDIFYAFKHSYLNAVKIMLIMNVKIFLWTLLFIIPGIIKSYEYSMIPYLLAEDPDLSCQEAFQLSEQMTDNEKLSMFILDFSFIGWYLLGALSCGIGTIFVTSYHNATHAELYIKLKETKNIQINEIPPIPDFY